MDQEQKNKTPETEAPVTATEEEPAAEPLELESAEEAEKPPTTAESSVEKRGRMVVAGLVATVVVSFVALLVAAIFQVTSRWLVPCPTDLPVNDPAPILWKAMLSEKVPPYQLGVSGEMLKDAGFKGEKPDSPEPHPATKE
ncbi:MAG: hypothetical protein HY913_08940 [Desulfomonile tiedjei]|nr:hypothetical protein [Desulfomonile tiedjei]